MDSLIGQVTLEEFRVFHGLDRKLYTFLVGDLSRNPSESLQIMGFWHWLERAGFRNLISRILPLELPLINRACDEALVCLQLIAASHLPPTTPPLVTSSVVPLTCCLLKTEANLLQFFSDNRLTIFQGMQNLVNTICIPALSDIMERAIHGGFRPIPSPAHGLIAPPSSARRPTLAPIGPPSPARALTLEDVMTRGFSGRKIAEGDLIRSDEEEKIPKFARTMFVTFSKGYPVTEAEVREFFGRLFGNCIEALYMQDVRQEEQALYARVVFVNPSYIHFILNGESKAKFSINGKHVWMRQFVPRNGKIWACGCSAVSCPHDSPYFQ